MWTWCADSDVEHDIAARLIGCFHSPLKPISGPLKVSNASLADLAGQGSCGDIAFSFHSLPNFPHASLLTFTRDSST